VKTLDNHRFLRETGPLENSDVRPSVPMCLVSPTNSCPVVCDFDMKVSRHLRNEESGAVCLFHPALPVVVIIIIHLLGLAPAGYLAAPDNGA
jgi:hypothetical protein